MASLALTFSPVESTETRSFSEVELAAASQQLAYEIEVLMAGAGPILEFVVAMALMLRNEASASLSRTRERAPAFTRRHPGRYLWPKASQSTAC